jgi:hypothetical protein
MTGTPTRVCRSLRGKSGADVFSIDDIAPMVLFRIRLFVQPVTTSEPRLMMAKSQRQG